MRHILAACKYSLAGFKTAFKDEAAFRQICICSGLGIPAAYCLGDNWQERSLLLLPLIIALIVELLNTAIESVVDMAQPDWHKLAKKAKDTGSAAQFCAQIFILLIWGGFLLEKI